MKGFLILVGLLAIALVLLLLLIGDGKGPPSPISPTKDEFAIIQDFAVTRVVDMGRFGTWTYLLHKTGIGNADGCLLIVETNSLSEGYGGPTLVPLVWCVQ